MQFYFPLRRLPTDIPGFWVMALLGLSWVCDSSAYFVGARVRPHAPGAAHQPQQIGRGRRCRPGRRGTRRRRCSASRRAVAAACWSGYGLAIGLATIVGDLVESLLKRQTGVKDSGVLIPGHGGLLDRMDSLLFCAPIAVLYLHAFAA